MAGSRNRKNRTYHVWAKMKAETERRPIPCVYYDNKVDPLPQMHIDSFPKRIVAPNGHADIFPNYTGYNHETVFSPSSNTDSFRSYWQMNSAS